MKRRVLIPIVLAALLGPACDGEPEVGELAVEFSTTTSQDRAIFFKVEAALPRTILGISADCRDCEAFSYAVSDTLMYAVITGPLVSGPIARVTVSDVGSWREYSLTLVEVAGRDHQLRPVSAYQLAFER